jgi:hypothetical protein
MFERGQNIVENRTGGRSAPSTVNSSVRTREYLTTAEIERLMAAARKSSRYGHRDATYDPDRLPMVCRDGAQHVDPTILKRPGHVASPRRS